jgi:hypothetical protein
LLEDEQTSKHGGGGRYNAILEFKGEQIKNKKKYIYEKEKEEKRRKNIYVYEKKRKYISI